MVESNLVCFRLILLFLNQQPVLMAAVILLEFNSIC